MPEAPLPNAPETRTETGEIKDQAPKVETPEAKTEPEAAPKAEEPKAEAKAKPEISLLNEKDEASLGAPEKYEDFKVPEGYTLDTEAAKEAGDLFKAMNLSQDQAQKLVDFYAKQTLKLAEEPYDDYVAQRRTWKDAVKAEHGADLPKVKAAVGKAIDSLGDAKLSADFREAMDLTGAGDHPAFVKAFYLLAQRAGEGTNVRGNGPSQEGQKAPGARPPSVAGALYPNLTSAG